jgi:TolB-like protein
MSKLKAASIFLFLPLLVFACSSTGVVRKPPVFRVAEITLGKGIDDTGSHDILLNPTTTFSTMDPEIISHVKFENLSGKHEFKWEWYDANGNLYYSTQNYPLETSRGKYIEEGTAWHKISVRGEKAQNYPGDWKVKFYLDDALIASSDRTPKIEKPKIIIKGEKVKIGIIEFQSLNDEAKKDNLGKIVSEMLTTSFVNSESFKIIEREQLQKVIKEFQLSQSGIIDTSYAKQIGKIAGADAIVTGSVTKIGNDLRLDARIIDIESGIILTAEKSVGKVDLKSIGIMTDRIVTNLVNKFYETR